MRFLIVRVALPALMALLLTEMQAASGLGNSIHYQACKTPEQPFYTNETKKNTDVLYIYNKTSQQCELVLIDKNINGTFNSRIECIQCCNTGRDTSFEYEYSEELLCSEFANMSLAYFYNSTSGLCEEYCACSEPDDRTDDVNFYRTEMFCNFMCGFVISTPRIFNQCVLTLLITMYEMYSMQLPVKHARPTQPAATPLPSGPAGNPGNERVK
ncbi:uncharacterized protein LOC142588899 [Dermacentor variabilis]|uniref:uncharacterized protein LOC142588899 n=1 Tax=Dermacentor variabilis TaxID=34621 RepID=UPI003F5BA054